MNRFFILFLLSVFCVFSAQSAHASSLLTPVKRVSATEKEIPVSTLPVQLTTTARNYEAARIQLPQQGDNLGIFTRKTTIYEARGSFSIVYDMETTAKTSDGKAYMGVIEPPKRTTKAALPSPRVEDANFLGGVFLETEEDVTYNPAATIRYPLKEQQYGNDGITVYTYNDEIEGYAQVEYTPSSDGRGIMIPVTKNGYYAVYDRPGIVPKGKTTASLIREKISSAQNSDKSFVVKNTFADITGHWSEEYVRKLDDAGIAPGKNPLLFAPDEAATRGDVIKMVVDKKFTREETNSCLSTYLPSEYVNVFFHDVKQNHPLAKYICMAAVHKMSSGLPDGTFAANRSVNRAEALKFLFEASGEKVSIADDEEIPFADVKNDEWFTAFVVHAAKKKVAKGFPVVTKISDAVQGNGGKRGSVGASVKNAKQALKDLNFYGGKVDTIFSSDFETAVIQYQLAKGVIETPLDLGAGIIGPKTAEYMNTDSGRSDNSQVNMLFKPHAKVTRAELSKFATLIFGL